MGQWTRIEKQIMEELGLKRQPGSGSGWVHKEDGTNFKILAQLKSTKGQSITVKKRDVKDLLYNAAVSHKVPVFILNFVDEFVLVAVPKDEMETVAKMVKGGKFIDES